jgi:hypothetical protein
VGVFAVMQVIGRREWVAVAVLFVFFLFASVFASGFPLLNQVGQAVRVAVALVMLLKFGILAMLAFYFTAIILMLSPLSLDPSTWYFGASLTYLLTLTALAV